jgi:hypothetical protein
VLDALDEGPNILELVPFRRERAVFGDGGPVIVFRMGDVSSGNGIEIRLEAEGKRRWGEGTGCLTRSIHPREGELSKPFIVCEH